jgi:hypothetical protein
MMKALKVMVLLTLVLGAIAVAAASYWLGRGVKAAIEKYGPGIVGAPVTVGSVILTPWSGRGAITDLVIGNPPGFKGSHALSVGSVEIAVKLSSLVTDTIVVESVVVREPDIRYEMGPSGSNLAQLQRSAERAGGKPDPEKDGGKGMFIRDLTVTGGKVGLSASLIGTQSMTVDMPDVKLSNLGGKGRSPAQAAGEALGAIAGSAGKAAGGIASKAASTLLSKLGGMLKVK